MDSHSKVQIELNKLFFLFQSVTVNKNHRKFMFQWSCRSLMFFLLKGILWDLPCPADWDYTSNGKIKCGLLWEDVFLNKNEWLSFLYVYQKLESHGLVKTYLPNVCHFLGQNIKSRTLNRAIWPVSFKFYIFCNAYRTFCRSKISVPQAFPWYSQGMTIEDYLRVVYICSVSHIIHTWLTAPIVVYGINTDWFP